MHISEPEVWLVQPIGTYLPYKWNIWRTLYLVNEGKNRIGEILNWRSILQQSISACIANVKL